MKTSLQICEDKTHSHVASVSLGADLADQGDRGCLCERGNGVLGELVVKGILALVEALVQDNRGLLDTLGLGQSGVVGGTEEEVVAEAVGGSGKGLVGSLVVGGKVTDQDDLVGRLEVVDGGLVDNRDGGHGLLGHVRNNAVEVAVSRIFATGQASKQRTPGPCAGRCRERHCLSL